MILSLAGGAGIGIVWGWILGMWGRSTPGPGRAGPAVIASTLLVSLEVLFLSDILPTAAFLAATLAGWLLCMAWQRSLRRLAAPAQGNA